MHGSSPDSQKGILIYILKEIKVIPWFFTLQNRLGTSFDISFPAFDIILIMSSLDSLISLFSIIKMLSGIFYMC